MEQLVSLALRDARARLFIKLRPQLLLFEAESASRRTAPLIVAARVQLARSASGGGGGGCSTSDANCEAGKGRTIKTQRGKPATTCRSCALHLGRFVSRHRESRVQHQGISRQHSRWHRKQATLLLRRGKKAAMASLGQLPSRTLFSFQVKTTSRKTNS